ncbi:MAG: phosphoenolpyruvate--protein phosphotransferase [Clostridia bacterium]|nr:phosphoenolpyruvate--protein phosphotransferase [Clostridia bacterium]
MNKRRKLIVSVICILLAVLMALSLIMMVVPARANAISEDDIAKIRDRRELLNQELQEQAEKIRQLTDGQALIIERKAALDRQIELNREDIALLEEEIDLYDQLIWEKSLELANAEQIEKEQEERLRVRMRAMEENGDVSYLRFIFDANSLSDLLSRMGDISDIMHYDRDLMDTLQDTCDTVSALKKEYETIRLEQDGIRGELAGRREQLNGQISSAGQLIAHLDELGDAAAAENASIEAAEAQAAVLRASGEGRIAERGADLLDVGERIAHAILGTRADMAQPPEGAILLADDLLPSQFAALDTGRIAGIALVRGGPTAHVAILAAGIGLPMIVAVGAPLEAVAEGTSLLIDCNAGFLRVDPDAHARAGLETAMARRAAVEARARTIGGAAVATADGVPVSVQANCGSVADAQAAMAAGADGCGLLRTEFLFLERTAAPDVDEQSATYRAIFAALPERPVTVRLLDVGGDKPAPYLALPAEENPALGLRGIRVALSRPEILEAQLSAILSLSAQGPLRIMVPMVASAGEMAAVRAVLDKLRGDKAVALGAMVETPAAAIGADLIAAEADFLSIGSNDLTQYALAADRGNAAVAAMLDGLHPAVLRLIAETCARAGSTPVSVCGGLAADPMAAPILIGLGVRTLSVPPAQLAVTKALVTTLTLTAATDHARQALACASAAEVRALARRFAEELSA